MGSVLFRVESGVGVGLGHIQRCLSLASALLEIGHASHFVVSGDASDRAKIERHGFTFSDIGGAPSGSEADSRTALDEVERLRSGALVIDSYRVGLGYRERLRSSSAALVALDDLVVEPGPVDIIVNPALNAAKEFVDAGGGAQLLLGPVYALLGVPYWDTPTKVITDPVERILVTMGGADGRNLTPLVVESLDSLSGAFELDIVVGPYNARRSEIDQVIAGLRRPARLLSGRDSLADLMAAADLAVSGGGQTLYELAATGTPVVAVLVSENQARTLVGMSEGGCLDAVVEPDREAIGVAVAEKVAGLIANRERRKAMGLAGRGVVDGQGARRVAEAIAALL